MDSKNFDEFVWRQQESSAVADDIDWDKERDDWLGYLNGLYGKIESFMEKYISSGQIRLKYKKIRLDEENIGSYAARQMTLRIGRQEVLLVPIGTLLVGARGRVDIIGPAGKAEMLLVDRKAAWAAAVVMNVKVGSGGKLLSPSESPKERHIEWEWRILSRPPERRFVEITQQSLFDLILEVANG